MKSHGNMCVENVEMQVGKKIGEGYWKLEEI
jgi:hypothetical protein